MNDEAIRQRPMTFFQPEDKGDVKTAMDRIAADMLRKRGLREAAAAAEAEEAAAEAEANVEAEAEAATERTEG